MIAVEREEGSEGLSRAETTLRFGVLPKAEGKCKVNSPLINGVGVFP